MKALYLIPAVCLLWACQSSPTLPTSMALEYPKTNKVAQSDEYFGTEVQDPYRWLEQDTAQKVTQWVEQQNELTFSYLAQIPYRDQIQQRLENLYDYPRTSAPIKMGPYIFTYRNDGLQNQSVIYIQKGLDGEPTVFIDPNTLSENGTRAVYIRSISEDERYLAYTIADAGSDWRRIYVRDLQSMEDLSDELQWIKSSGIAWFKDGFFYSRYPSPEAGKELSGQNNSQAVYYHKLGTPQASDKLIYEDKDNPNHFHGIQITEDKQYLVLYKRSGTDAFETWFKATDLEEGGFMALHRGFKNRNYVMDHEAGKFLLLTNVDATNYRLVSVDITQHEVENWSEVIAEQASLLNFVSVIGNKLFASYLEDAQTRIYHFDYDGSNKQAFELPGPGTARISYTKKKDTQFFYTFTSYLYPSSVYSYDMKSGESSLFFAPEIDFDPTGFESKQVFYESKDGTRVPMFITHKKGLSLDGSNPTYLYGYGGFTVNSTPYFSVSNLWLIENGGILAIPCLRGGGEYGEDWHQAGMLFKKQNVFDDFIAAAEYLIQEGYTTKERLAIAGGSNGGLLVGACMNQRPELFQVAFPAVGVMDMLRYHKFTIGWAWVPEYGCADSSKAHFDNLYGYSPLHNLSPNTAYPATLVTTADHDDRVVPAHSFKYAATLQEMHSGSSPVLIRIQTDAGHGAGKPIGKYIEEQADKWAFMYFNMGVLPEATKNL